MYSVAVRTAARRVAVAPISRSIVVGKRFTSTVHENDPKVIELEKQRNLRNEQHKTSTPIKNAPGWNQYLASDSEADIKADRSEASLEELTTETVQHINERHHKTEEHVDTESEADVRADRSAASAQELANGNAQRVHSEERLDAYEASYERDETSGPLKKGSTKSNA